MKFLVGSVALVFGVCLFTSCQSGLTSAPPITEAFVRAGLRGNADAHTLTEGRKVFLDRCIACHALPDPARFDRERLTRIVGWMSGRAHLTAAERDALVKYLQTVKSQAR